MNIFLFILVGIVAGWLAGRIMKGKGFGLIGDLIVGVIGAFLGSWVLSLFGVSFDETIIGTLVTALIGAVLLLFLLRLIRR